jgi:hypothetical protein
MLFQCGVTTSDDNGEVEVGNEAFYFPKLNLSASLYDSSGLRSLSETGGLLSVASTAEDVNNAPTAPLSANAILTPLLATNAATEAAVGTTDNTSRSDQYYNEADYDAWGRTGTTANAASCVYYTATMDTNTGLFANRWDKATNNTGALILPVVTSDSIADTDTQADIPLADYTIIGTRTVTTSAGDVLANIAQGPTGCGVLGSNTYAFVRKPILNMTEATSAPADLAAFKATTAACGQNNIVAGSELDTNLTAISGPGTGFNNDHLVLTLADWRTVDNSKHWTSSTQTVVANGLNDGSSMKDLMQIVGVTDANSVAATAGNGRGVLIVDGTPALATYMTNDGTTLEIGFDQTISLGDANGANEFTLQGDGALYTFNKETIGGTATWEVRRSTAYVDRFGATLALNTDVDITLDADINPGYDVDGDGTLEVNVPASTANSRIKITMVDADVTAGNNAVAGGHTIDYSDFFNELSHSSATSKAGTAAAPSFYLDYGSLQDANFNSWTKAAVETYDRYDDGGTPRLIGVDKQAPQLFTVAATLATNDPNGSYLVDSPGTLTVSSVHVTDDQDGDILYTGSTTGAITSVTTDTELRYVYGYANGNNVAKSTDGNQRLVVKLSSNVNATMIRDAIAYIYRPNVETDDAGITSGLGGLNDSVLPSGDMDDNAVSGGGAIATAFSGALATSATGSVGHHSSTHLVLELPSVGAVAPVLGDQIVIQNLLHNGHFYSIHIPAPAALNYTNVANPGVAPSTTEAGIASVSAKVYRQVAIDDTNGVAATHDGDVTPILTGTAFTSATAAPTVSLPFRERLASVSATWADGQEDEDNIETDDDTVNFAGGITATVNTGSKANLVLTATSATSNAITEADGDSIGHDAALTVTVKDFASNESTVTVTLRKGHNTTVTAQAGTTAALSKVAILNTLSGTAVSD